MAIEAIVFDVGNVLVEWHPERPFDRLLGERRRRELFAAVDFEGMNARSDLGEDMRAGVEALAAAHPGIAGEIRIWADRWLEMLAPDLPGPARMLRALRAEGLPVHALTNFGDATFELARERYPVLREFDRCFVSGRLGVAKPDPAIYGILERETGHSPGAILFFDDRPENVAAAAARGWRACLFDGEAGMERRLAEEGLLAATPAA